MFDAMASVNNVGPSHRFSFPPPTINMDSSIKKLYYKPLRTYTEGLYENIYGLFFNRVP